MKMNHQECLSRLLCYAVRYERLYLYGAGFYGGVCRKYLNRHGIQVTGFIVSEAIKRKEKDGLPIFVVDEILPRLGENDAVVLSMRPDSQEKVSARLQGSGKNVLTLSMQELICFEYEPAVTIFSRLAAEHNAAPFTQLSDYKNILVIRLDVIGDMIWTSAFFRELRCNAPKTRITLVLRREVYDVVRNCPYIDELICYDMPSDEIVSQNYELMELRAKSFARKYLCNRNFDLLFLPRCMSFYDCQENIFLAAYSDVSVRIGRVDATDLFGSLASTVLQPMMSIMAEEKNWKHEVKNILGLLRLVGGTVASEHMELWPSIADWQNADKLLAKYRRPLVVLALEAREANRGWSSENYRDLVEMMAARLDGGITFLLLGGKGALVAKDALQGGVNCLDLIGRTSLMQAASIIGRAQLYIGPNTGLLHMASAMNVPVIEISAQLQSSKKLFSGAPQRAGAWGVPYIPFMPEHGADSECENAGVCVKKHTHCTNQILPATVVEAAIEMLKKYNR